MGDIESTRSGDRQNGDLQRAERLALRRSTYNEAADCWPGWSIPEQPPDAQTLERGFALAKRSRELTEELELGPITRATANWLCGAFELAFDKRADACATFSLAREQYIAGNAPGLVLLVEGYIAIARREDLESICARMAAGGFEDGVEWIAQLRTAQDVFNGAPR